MRFTRKVLLECAHFDNLLMKGKLILPCQLVFSYFHFAYKLTSSPPPGPASVDRK